jgi:hypothetical protein
MKLSNIATLAGVSPSRLKVIKQRGQIPFAHADGPIDADHPIEDAVSLRLMQQAALSIPVSAALHLSERAIDKLRPFNVFAFTGADLWVALVRYDWPGMSADWEPHAVVGGRFEDLHPLAVEAVAAIDPGATILSIFTVNASQAAREVWAEGKRREMSGFDSPPGVPEDLSGYPAWFREVEAERRKMFANWHNAPGAGE